VEEGRIAEVAAYCETDVVSTFRVWLAYELLREALAQEQFRASEESLCEYLDGRPPGLPGIAASEIVVPHRL